MKIRPEEKTATGNRVPTLCWWITDNSGLHEAGANFTPEQMCDTVATLGAKHDIPPRAQWKLIGNRDQKVDCTMCEWSGSLAGEAPFGPSIGDEDPDRRAEIVKQMKAWMDLCQIKGIPKMLCFFGNASGDDADAQWARIDEALIKLTEHAETTSVQLCFEPLNSVNFGDIPLAGMKGHPGQFCSDPMQFLEHIKRVGKPEHCAMAFDFYHPAAQFRDAWLDGVEGTVASKKVVTAKLIEMFDTCREYVGHIHVAGCYADDRRMRGELHLPGQLINYREVMAHVWASGYDGNWLIEYVSTAGSREADISTRQGIVLDGMKKAVALCQPSD